MASYKKQFTFKIEDENRLKTKLEYYFNQYEYLFKEGENNQYIFFKKFSCINKTS